MRLFITGGSRGIGRAIVEELHQECETVAILGRSFVNLAVASAELSGRVAQVTTICSDLADLDGTRRSVRDWAATQEALDVLVLCAGTYTEGNLDDLPYESFDHDIRVNLGSSLVIAQELAPLLAAGSSPRIVIIGSTAAHEPYPAVPSYGVAKWGLRGLATNLREELRPRRIGVTFISPGGTLTDMWDGEDVPPHRLLRPEDVARVVRSCLQLSEQAVVEELIIRPIEGDLHD